MNIKSPLHLYYKNKLSQSPLFSELSDKTLDKMLGQFHHITWNKGVVRDVSVPSPCFYLIIEGRVKIECVDASSGSHAILSLLGAGDGFDVISLLDGLPHETIPTALDDVSLLCAPMQTVRDWINCHPAFNRTFLPYLGEYMRNMESLATDLAMTDTGTRLARLVLRHTTLTASTEKPHHQVRLIHDLSHESLAHMIGSTRQVVNKHLQALRHQGILDEHSRHLVVSELKKLEEKAGVLYHQSIRALPKKPE